MNPFPRHKAGMQSPTPSQFPRSPGNYTCSQNAPVIETKPILTIDRMRIRVRDVTLTDVLRLDMDRIRRFCFLCAGAMFIALAPQTRADELGDRLLAAAQKGDAAGVRAVLAKGVDVNTKFRYGTTALLYAAQKGNPEVVRADCVVSSVSKLASFCVRNVCHYSFYTQSRAFCFPAFTNNSG